MNSPEILPGVTQQQFAKQPAYIREAIEGLIRERDKANDNLAAYMDSQTESNIWFTDRDGNKVYISADASERLTVRSKCGTVYLGITNYDDDKIKLSWSGGRDEYGMGDVCFIPTAYQQARLVHPSNAHAR
jgi:hypothetical protein